MARLVWDERDYDAGLDRGVFYAPSGIGEAWNGLTSVQESPSDSDGSTIYLDGIKSKRTQLMGEFSGTIEAFTYPDSFFEDVLGQRRRLRFGLSYRVKDKVHLVYNVRVGPASFDYQQEEMGSFSWEFTTFPIPVPGANPSAHLIVDTSMLNSETIVALEDVLYGSESMAPHLPTPEEILAIFEANATLVVVDNGDGSFTVTGPDEAIRMLDSTTFEIDWPSAVYIGVNTYKLGSR